MFGLWHSQRTSRSSHALALNVHRAHEDALQTGVYSKRWSVRNRVAQGPASSKFYPFALQSPPTRHTTCTPTHGFSGFITHLFECNPFSFLSPGCPGCPACPVSVRECPAAVRCCPEKLSGNCLECPMGVRFSGRVRWILDRIMCANCGPALSDFTFGCVRSVPRSVQSCPVVSDTGWCRLTWVGN